MSEQIDDSVNVEETEPNEEPVESNDPELSSDEQQEEQQPEEPEEYKLSKEEYEEFMKNKEWISKANQKFREAAEQRKQAERVFEQLKSNPQKALKEVGLNFDEVALKHLEQLVEEDELSDEEKKIRDYERKLKEYEEKERLEKERQQQEQISKAAEEHKKKYIQDINQALQAHNLPKNEGIVRRMISKMSDAISNGFDIPVDNVARLVKEEISSDLNQTLKALPADQVIQMLGEDFGEKIRKFYVEKLPSFKNKNRENSKPAASELKASTFEELNDLLKSQNPLSDADIYDEYEDED